MINIMSYMHWLIISKINVDRFQLDNSLKSAPPILLPMQYYGSYLLVLTEN